MDSPKRPPPSSEAPLGSRAVEVSDSALLPDGRAEAVSGSTPPRSSPDVAVTPQEPGDSDVTPSVGASIGVADDRSTDPGGPAAAEDATAAMPQTTGATVLGGRYLLEERIAAGGMAAVWRAHDEVLARTVAVKVLHGHLAADEAFRERFRREAIAAAKLTHPAVVSVYDTGADGDAVYLVMEYVDGVTLKDVIAESGALTPGEAATIGEKVARGLAYAHDRGLVHRDVKPANILIGHDGSVKVADFGIAKAEETGDDLTNTGMVLGTAAYVAPEQITAQVIDGRADQYALGCVLYEALAGRQPFKGDNAVTTAAQRLDHAPLPLRQVRADVPKELSAVLDRALARDPADRYPDTRALADALAPHADADADRTAALVVPVALAEAVADEEAAGPQPTETSFLRSEGRWLAPVLALLVLAGTLVGVGLATGVLESTGGIPFTFARGSDAPATAAPTPTAEAAALQITDAEDFDPLGDGRENPEDLNALLDGDPATAWQTEGYDTPALGGLKPGVGFVLDLGAEARLDAVTLTTTTPGIAYELRTPADGASPEGGSGALDDWQVVATVEDAAGVATSDLGGVEAEAVLVWITGDLQPTGPRHRAGFSAVTVEGVPLAQP